MTNRLRHPSAFRYFSLSLTVWIVAFVLLATMTSPVGADNVEGDLGVEGAGQEPFRCPKAGNISVVNKPGKTQNRKLKPFTKATTPAPDVDGSKRPFPGYSGFVGFLGRKVKVVNPIIGAPKEAPKGISPLTGTKSRRAEKPAVVVKVANTSQARPQSGLERADIVVEEQVETGITRFLAIYQTQATVVGPVRSVRSTDIAIVNSLRRPAFLYSGGNRVFVDLIRDQRLVDVSEGTCARSFDRISSKRAPHNLYSRTGPIQNALKSSPPKTQFRFRDKGDKVGGEKAKRARISYKANLVDWQWHPRKKVWQRWQGGQPHYVASGEQIAAENVIIAEVERVDSGLRDVGRSVVTEDVFIGEGRALIFTKGRVIRATWNRSRLSDVVTYTHRRTDKPIFITPGKTWVQLAARGEFNWE